MNKLGKCFFRKSRLLPFLTGLSIVFTLFFIFPLDKTAVQVSSELEQSCTSILVGRLASTDGSVMTSHTCDAFGDRTWANIVLHSKNSPNAMTAIYNNTKGPEFAGDLRFLEKTTEIPQAEETYAYLNTAYPCMNEYQLGIGETTIGGRRELQSRKGLLPIEELCRLVLQRTKTARDAIRLIGNLVKEYGYNDTGECLTFIDVNEAWQLEIMGPGRDRIGAVWAAVRIPDDQVGVSANIPRIAEIDLSKPDYYMASDNVFSLAEEMGWYNPKSGEKFKFWKAYSGSKPFGIREYWILSTLAPSLKLKFDADELPFSVKPEKKVSPRDIMVLFRETYTGTEYDMLKNLKVRNRQGEMVASPVVSPWMNSDMRDLINSIKPGTIERFRPIAVETCAYSTVIQARGWLPDAVGGICWFGWQHPAMSPRAPIFAGVTELPPDFNNGAHRRYRTDSAAWAFRSTERLAVIIWGQTKPILDKTVKEFEDKAFTEVPNLEKQYLEIYKTDPEKANALLTQYTNSFCRAMTQKYWELGAEFWSSVARKW
jgi:dipeptidase